MNTPTPDDTATPPERPILRFYISMSYDAQTHVMYAYAPTNWADMTEEEREKFLEEEAEEWAQDKIEYGAHVHDPDEQRNPWGEFGGDPSKPEEIFD